MFKTWYRQEWNNVKIQTLNSVYIKHIKVKKQEVEYLNKMRMKIREISKVGNKHVENDTRHNTIKKIDKMTNT